VIHYYEFGIHFKNCKIYGVRLGRDFTGTKSVEELDSLAFSEANPMPWQTKASSDTINNADGRSAVEGFSGRMNRRCRTAWPPC
jgi:hypothetical protein